eukprot:GFYU01011443.1.p1 GENE.GFYU01011443.1~~GFYU01011443.1.p1  ORF type:complete len:249 (+),score=68.50 GFYU01011443.1:148-894(+)
MSATTFILVALLGLTSSLAHASCLSDSDCPSSYCLNDPTKTPPYMCQGCLDYCCLTDTDCSAKLPGSWCLNDPAKKPPYVCHGAPISDNKMNQSFSELLRYAAEKQQDEQTPVGISLASVTATIKNNLNVPLVLGSTSASSGVVTPGAAIIIPAKSEKVAAFEATSDVRHFNVAVVGSVEYHAVAGDDPFDSEALKKAPIVTFKYEVPSKPWSSSSCDLQGVSAARIIGTCHIGGGYHAEVKYEVHNF